MSKPTQAVAETKEKASPTKKGKGKKESKPPSPKPSPPKEVEKAPTPIIELEEVEPPKPVRPLNRLIKLDHQLANTLYESEMTSRSIVRKENNQQD